MVEPPLMVVRSTELFFVPTSVPRLVYVLSCLWDGTYKRSLAANRSGPCNSSSGFPLSLSEWSFTICPTP